MLGQNIPNARKVVLLIEDENGREFGWMIHNPANVRWSNYSMVNGSAHATIMASGEFQRMSKSPRSREIEARLNHEITELEEGRRELPQGRD